MSNEKQFSIALVGNPNCGKSSVFNELTGLRQKVANFPGVTVDKKIGHLVLPSGKTIQLIDFPGTYSLYPTSTDEKVVVSSFCNPTDPNYPDAIVYIADISQLDRHMLLFTQLRDLGFPILLVLNMLDIADAEGLVVDLEKLRVAFGVPVIAVSSRVGTNMSQLKSALDDLSNTSSVENPDYFYRFSSVEKNLAAQIKARLGVTNTYRAIVMAHHYHWLPFLLSDESDQIEKIAKENGFEDLPSQVTETMQRFDTFQSIVRSAISQPADKHSAFTDKIDQVLTHAWIGPIFFLLTTVLMFQAIYSWASFPMDFIEGSFTQLSQFLKSVLPANWMTGLLVDGILAGMGGIFVFVPQIAILFAMISLLEEVGYMSRAVFLFDGLMQKFGLNGRSLVSLVSGGACAIPAIMSTRTITNSRERLITILVTPLISCSARIPVYAMLIGFVVPPGRTMWGLLNIQGLAFAGLYLLGILAALLSAIVFSKILKTDEPSSLMIELPPYRTPSIRNVLMTVYEKVVSFIRGAGQIILIISVILWVLASFGPGDSMQEAEKRASELATSQQMSETQRSDLVAAYQIEASYAGQIGKWMEPVIKPLGFDWKIGIALVTSFAAREVFVGTMATIYSIGSASEEETTIREHMMADKNPVTGQPVYTTASSWSLLIFYVFAMQCMSTLAVVRRETKSWKWPLVQLIFMSALAYLSSFLVFHLL